MAMQLQKNTNFVGTFGGKTSLTDTHSYRAMQLKQGSKTYVHKRQ